MIRREEIDPDGTPVWLLIDQIEHAHLAAALAEKWNLGAVLPEQVRAPWLAAVRHHDDGWAEWDGRPTVDPRNRQPLAFNEMPTEQSTAIWRRSVAAGTAIGPLAEYAIAGHFRALLLRYDSWRTAGAAAQHSGERFRLFADATMQAALAAWLSPAEGRTVDVADEALHLLQFFDALSLWFCCQPRTAPHTFSAVGLPDVTLSPAARPPAATAQPSRMVVEPWPFTEASVELSAEGVAIPAVPLDGTHLDRDRGQRARRLCWRLVPQ